MSYLQVLLLSLILFISCSENKKSQELSNINEDLMHDSVDAALKKIQSIKPYELANEEEYNYYNLLKIQIFSRKFQVVPSNLIDSCINFYKKIGDKDKLADAYYYKGGVLYDNKNIQEGVLLFKQAETLADNVGHNTLLQYKIYESLTFCNFESANYFEALLYAKKCVNAATRLKSPERYLFAKYYESISYNKLGKQDSADICTKQYIPYIKYGDKDIQRDCLAEVSAYYLNKKDTAKAEEFLQKAFQLGYNPLVCGIAGMYYMAIKDNEKAESMYKKMLTLTTNMKYHVIAYHYLGQIKDLQNNFKEASFYYNKETEANNMLIAQRQEESTMRIQSTFEKSSTANSNTRRLSIISYLCMGLGGLLVMTVVVAIVMNRHKSRRLRQAGRDLEASANEIADLQRLNGNNQKEIGKLKRNMDKNIENYVKQLSHGRRLYEGLALGKFIEKRDSKAMKNLIAYYRIVDSEFFESVDREYEKLTTQNVLILMLRHIGKSDADIAELLGVSDSSMRSYNHRIRESRKDITEEDWVSADGACRSERVCE